MLYQKTLTLLPAQRRESAERMKIENGKRLSAGAGLLLMAALADALADDGYSGRTSCGMIGLPGTEPADGERVSGRAFRYRKINSLSGLRFGQGEHGKPYLCDYPQVHFNLSHSGKRVMCVVSAHACGCDVEQVDRRQKQIDMVIRCLAASEQRLAAISAVHFCRIWTLKESILKLSGEGIVIPLNSFEVSLDPPAVRQDFFPEPILLKEYDTFQNDYCCSLALSGGEPPETMTEVDLGRVLEI